MHEPAARQCPNCRFSRKIGERLCCIRNPPTADPVTAQARWPQVAPTDRCARFRPIRANDDSPLPRPPSPPNPQPDAATRANDDSPLQPSNQESQIENHKWPSLAICRDGFGPYCKIPLTQGKFAKVDPADYVWLSQFRWCVKVGPDRCYAVRTVQIGGKSKRIYMHRQIMNTPPHLVCDHKNHDGLDNRRRNLRNCNTAQNNANRRKRAPRPGSRAPTSQYLGVSWDKRRGIWTAHIKHHGRQTNLGQFDNEQAAARAYDQAATKTHGSYAAVNFPHETTTNNESHQSHESNGKL